jgi:hypothetical protein
MKGPAHELLLERFALGDIASGRDQPLDARLVQQIRQDELDKTAGSRRVAQPQLGAPGRPWRGF